MFKNRFILILATLSMLLVTLAASRSFSKPPKTVDLSQPPRPVVVPATGAGEQPYVMDSATRSYIARGQAMQVRNTIDSGMRSYIAWGKALEASTQGSSGRAPLDECFDVSLSEVAACREASESTSP